jgi:endonuclease/exonuclease/phosphatase family metal-dependent hydrolase
LSPLEERGVRVLFTEFAVDGKYLWVINMHMPIETSKKLQVIQWLNMNAQKLCKQRVLRLMMEIGYTPLIFLGGDMNTSKEDKDAMMVLFKEKWTHLTEDVSITFNSFPHDLFQGEGCLDHIFVNSDAADQVKSHVAGVNMSSASNHGLLYVTVEI